MAMINCPKCGEKISSKAKMCPKCQADLEEEPRKIIICKDCGQSIFEDQGVCPYCGRPINQGKKQAGKILAYVSCFLGIFSFFLYWIISLFTSILGVIAGWISSELNNEKQKVAWVGMVISTISFAISIFCMIFYGL